MKNRIQPVLVALALFLILNLQPSTAFAQGSLTPPGPPAPTMKTLDQVEPRTPIATNTTPGDGFNTFIISQPGSYYLTTNVVSGGNGIFITANDVTLDLNGFTVQGEAASVGIYIESALTSDTVRNGTVSGFSYGVYEPNAGYTSTSSNLVLVLERLNVVANGEGIWLYGSAVVRDCNIQSNSAVGIAFEGENGAGNGTVSGCTADYNGGSGMVFADNVTDCTADNNGGTGISGVGRVTGCEANNNVSDGIYLESQEGIVSGCTANGNGGDGIGIQEGPGIVSGCTANNNGGNGIDLQVASYTVSGCAVSGNTMSGIYVGGAGAEVIGNNCIANNGANSTNNAGIYISGFNNRIEDNHVTSYGGNGNAGIEAGPGHGSTPSNNIIIKNSVIGNGANNFVVATNNDLGPVGTATNSISPWANISH